MRSWWMVVGVALAITKPVGAQSYHVAGQLAAGDGGWDLLSVDRAGQRA